MRKKYHTKMEFIKYDGPDKSRYEQLVKDTLLTKLLYQAKNEIEVEETYNPEKDTVEHELGLAILSIEEYDNLKRIEREYNRFNTRQTNANDSRCKL